jgi:hypothetical protein
MKEGGDWGLLGFVGTRIADHGQIRGLYRLFLTHHVFLKKNVRLDVIEVMV